MILEGTIKVINPEVQVSASFVKREFVITTDETYPQHISIELHQDKADLIDPYKVGDLVKVSLNLRGREWINPQGESRYFNTITAWRIEKIQTQEPEPYKATPTEAFEPTTNLKEEEHDDLPFG